MTEQEAIARAREIAAAKGWAWVEPAQPTFHRGWFGRSGKWEIFSNARGLGAKVRVMIDDATGAILEEGYIPR
jgi:hypothetical protein